MAGEYTPLTWFEWPNACVDDVQELFKIGFCGRVLITTVLSMINPHAIFPRSGPLFRNSHWLLLSMSPTYAPPLMCFAYENVETALETANILNFIQEGLTNFMEVCRSDAEEATFSVE